MKTTPRISPDDVAAPRRRSWVVFAPVGVFALIAGAFAVGLLELDPNSLPSTLIDQPAPAFALPPLRAGAPGLSKADLETGAPTLLNVWASWCGPCRYEHPVLMRLSEMEGVRLVGLNYKDAPENAVGFLDELGDPFTLIGSDRDGRAGIEWGVYGVPETFVIAGDGTVIYKHVGPLGAGDIEGKLLPALEKARARP